MLKLPLIGKIAGGLIFVLLLFAGLQTYRLSQSEHKVARTEAALQKARDDATIFAEGVRATSERITAQMNANALAIERRQAQITQEVSHEYQTRLAELRARYAGSVRPNTSSGAGASGGGSSVSIPTPASGGPNATAQVDIFAAEANALQLEALQNWVSRVLMRIEP